jgi:hypothetical protein
MGGGCDSVKAIKGKFSAARYADQMGYQNLTIKGVGAEDLPSIWTEAQLLRGAFLDAFARVEMAVMLYAGLTGAKVTPAMPLSQKLTALEKERKTFKNPRRLDVRIAAIRELLPVRADVVHSVLEVAITFDGRAAETKMQFQNASDAARRPLALTTDQLTSMTSRLTRLATQFSYQRLLAKDPT